MELSNINGFSANINPAITEKGKTLWGAVIAYKGMPFRRVFYGDLPKSVLIKRCNFIINNSHAEENNGLTFITLPKEKYSKII